jgi:aspartyl-tRNA(Asn)/glutamyl-tRNA(Gln) amidotransferase subunit A
LLQKRVTLAAAAADLASGSVSSTALTAACLDRIRDIGGEGVRSFIRTYDAQALAAAHASDQLRTHGITSSPLGGIPLSVKDVFDVAGEATTAGSAILAGAPHALSDAVVVGRLRAAGAIIVGKTNMTEFAYSTLGLNPHYGTPRNPYDPARIPGGSSCGAAAAVAYGFSMASIGSDTGGSVRIPAAFCGLVGFKPTQRRIPRGGMFPLSSSLDSIGPIASSVACCALLDAVMAGEAPRPALELAVRGLRLAIPTRYLTEGLDSVVGRGYERALARLRAAGAQTVDSPLGGFHVLDEIEALGGVIGPEAYAVHRPLLAEHRERYDPRVRSRLEDSATATAANYLAAITLRDVAVAAFNESTRPFDAVLAPTVVVVPPLFRDIDSDNDYRRINVEVRRNASAFNLLDRCALTLPCHEPGELPVGLMIVGERGQDARLLSLGIALEQVLSSTA